MRKTIYFMAIFALAACASDNNGGAGTPLGGGASSGSGGSGAAVPGANCSDRCTNVANKCGFGAAAAEQCGAVCATKPTEAKLLCLESAVCATLPNDPCKLAGTPDPGGSGGTGGTGGTGGSTSKGGTGGTGGSSSKPFLKNGDGCDCGDPNTVICASTEGPCEPELQCFTGTCVTKRKCSTDDSEPPCDAGDTCYILGTSTKTGFCGKPSK